MYHLTISNYSKFLNIVHHTMPTIIEYATRYYLNKGLLDHILINKQIE